MMPYQALIFSWDTLFGRDLILLSGGLFLLAKSTLKSRQLEGSNRTLCKTLRLILSVVIRSPSSTSCSPDSVITASGWHVRSGSWCGIVIAVSS
jgi:hypothetical protein